MGSHARKRRRLLSWLARITSTGRHSGPDDSSPPPATREPARHGRLDGPGTAWERHDDPRA